jgi:hypothetical protein
LWHSEQVPAKIWEGLLPASRFSACAEAAARQPIRNITAAKLSARLDILVLQMRKPLQHPNPRLMAAITF